MYSQNVVISIVTNTGLAVMFNNTVIACLGEHVWRVAATT